MHPLLSKINYFWLTIISGIAVLVILGVLFLFKDVLSDNTFSGLTNILISILTCVLVSFWWNKLLLDASNHYEKSGIKNYYNDFSEVEPIIKKKLKGAKKATIFFMYGKTFINGSSSQIKKMLSKKGNKLVFVIASPSNPFIEKYEEFWDYPVRANIESAPETIKKLFLEISKESRADLQIYLYKDGGYCYSYYQLDDEVYLSPNKMVEAKSFKPITIHAVKKSHKNCLYKKVKQEFNFMRDANQIELVFDSTKDNAEVKD